MPRHAQPGNARRPLAASLVAAIALAIAVSSAAPAISAAPTTGRPGATRSDVAFDSRAGGVPVAVAPRVADARRGLAARLGPQGVVLSDRTTGTLRFVGRLDGYLTRPSAQPARRVALGYVRANLVAFGLRRADLKTLSLRNDYVDILGTHHLSWVQQVRGVRVFGNGLKANVAADGRLINLSGAPVRGLRPNATRPGLTSSRAIATTRIAAGALTSNADARDGAELVLFATGRGARLAWQTTTFVSSSQVDLSVVDAISGASLYRTNMVRNDSPGTGSAWELTASSAVPNGGGVAAPVTFPVADASRLAGNNAHAWADINDDDVAQASEEVPAVTGLDWSGYAPVIDTTSPFNCSEIRPCSWDPTVPFGWRASLPHNVEQVYHFVNTFHDHLNASPIGFTEAAGNFQLVNTSGQGEGGDALQAHAMDGANVDDGFPDGFHIDNANMLTPPDGTPPRMQMYLFVPVQGLPKLPTANGGDDAEIVYHEYTHGLSNRLVTTPDGIGAVSGPQPRAMGEGWSDWYAMDYLNGRGFKPDDPGDGNLIMGFYTFPGLRESATDCPVGSSSGNCGTSTAGPGGYTYGDFGHVVDGAEVHADGEIWAQTLWQLRGLLGQLTTEGLVTRAMELSPPEPSFLDMRNAILQADLVGNAGANQDAIWSVFAERGMGFFAAAVDGGDTSPVEDFDLPPDCSVDPCGAIRGKVVDKATGRPVRNARVYVAGLASGFGNDLGTKTAGDGTFRIDDVPFHDAYPEVVIDAAGYERAIAKGLVVNGDETLNRKVKRDWAALEAGARIVSATPPDYTSFGCGPANAFDLSLGSGWGSDAPQSTFGSNVEGPRKVVVRLPKPIKVGNFGVASNGTCGDGPAAAVKGFTIQTRTLNGDWITVVKANADNDGRLRTYDPEGKKGLKKVRFIRFIMRSTHGDNRFMDVIEVTVRGR